MRPDNGGDGSDDEFVEEFVDAAGALIGRIAAMDDADRIAAACRGSANPAALRWLADTLQLTPEDVVVDAGTGLGGPAAWLRAEVRCAIVAADPSPTAAAGARQLFGLPAVQAPAAPAPFADRAFDAVLLLGVLSVVDDRATVLREALRTGRRVGVLDYCSTSADTVHAGGSAFAPPEQLAGELRQLWTHVDLVRVDAPTPAAWNQAAERARAGVPQPDSEREVVDAIESGRLTLHALVGR